jgi:TRAP-type C4-dicarboxylate transport system permease small subunit
MKIIKKPKWKKTLIKSLILIFFILVAHLAFLYFFFNVDVISKGFSAGGLKQPWILGAVTAFVVVRFLAVLLLPGILFACAGMVLFDYFYGRKKSDAEDSKYFKL